MSARSAWAAITCAVVVLLAGCSGDATNDDDRAPGAVTPATDEELGKSIRWAPGPLNDLVGEEWVTDAAEYVEGRRVEEDLIAACMIEQGFEYIPRIPRIEDIQVGTDTWDYGSPAFVERYGFGIVEMPEDSFGTVRFTNPPDPNTSITASMSAAELEEYRTTMEGALVEREESKDGSSWTELREGGGCRDQARLGVAPGDAETVVAAEEATRYFRAQGDSPILDPLNTEWSECARGHGLTDASPGALESRMLDELSGPVVPSDEEATALQAEEIEIARIDLECRRSTNYDVRYRDLVHADQAAYIASIPELRALAETGGQS